MTIDPNTQKLCADLGIPADDPRAEAIAMTLAWVAAVSTAKGMRQMYDLFSTCKSDEEIALTSEKAQALIQSTEEGVPAAA